MVDYADWKFLTAPTVAENTDPVIGPILQQLRNEGHTTFHFLKKWMTVAVPAAEAEIRTDFTDLFDGVATPAIVAADSSDNTQDKAGGTGALTVKHLSSTSAHVLSEETITLNGTTVVDGTQLNEHVNEAKCVTYGSDGNPTGTIQIINHADNKVYAKIANTGHAAINARTYVPAGYTGYLVVNARANYNGITSTSTGRVIGEGAQVRWKYVTLDANEPTDLAILPITVGPITDGWADITPPKIVRAGAADEYVTVLIDSVDSDLAGLVSLEWTVMMWV
jgi:hypothetical protein